MFTQCKENERNLFQIGHDKQKFSLSQLSPGIRFRFFSEVTQSYERERIRSKGR